tara:strand:+ start:533 stop:682 length:150 start_codon:yes stop_codon:yes gene_type:complete
MLRTKSEKIAAAKKRHGFTAVNKPRRGAPTNKAFKAAAKTAKPRKQKRG